MNISASTVGKKILKEGTIPAMRGRVPPRAVSATFYAYHGERRPRGLKERNGLLRHPEGRPLFRGGTDTFHQCQSKGKQTGAMTSPWERKREKLEVIAFKEEGENTRLPTYTKNSATSFLENLCGQRRKPLIRSSVVDERGRKGREKAGNWCHLRGGKEKKKLKSFPFFFHQGSKHIILFQRLALKKGGKGTSHSAWGGSTILAEKKRRAIVYRSYGSSVTR